MHSLSWKITLGALGVVCLVLIPFTVVGVVSQGVGLLALFAVVLWIVIGTLPERKRLG